MNSKICLCYKDTHVEGPALTYENLTEQQRYTFVCICLFPQVTTVQQSINAQNFKYEFGSFRFQARILGVALWARAPRVSKGAPLWKGGKEGENKKKKK